MKLAILLLCHKSAEQVNLLLDALTHSDISVFVHVDKNSSIAKQLTSRPNVWILPETQRVACQWGSLSLVKATLNLLQYASQKDTFDYFWLCSGQDFPIKSIEQILAYLKKHSGKEFIDLFPSAALTGHPNNYDKRTAIYYPSYMLHPDLGSRIIKRIYTEITGGYNHTWIPQRPAPEQITFYFGSQWWCLSAKMINWVLDYVQKHPDFMQFYVHSVVPDECFFHTLVMNSPYGKNRMDALHYIDWSEKKNSPKTLTLEDLPALKKSNKLMARKFDLQTNGKVICKLCSNVAIKRNSQPVRVLQIVGSLGINSGVNAVVLNWHRYIDARKIQFDYLYCTGYSRSVIKDTITHLGARCYELPLPFQHPIQFLKKSYLFFKTHHYNTVHSHEVTLNFFYFPLAKYFGTKNIIQHAHSIKWSDKKLNGWRNYLMLHAVWPLITHKMACSQAAGKAYFGKNFTVINNGIDVEKFAYSPSIRAAKRKELSLENNFVIGHVGRFALEKNHTFLIDIFEHISQQNPSAKLVLVGDGPQEDTLKSRVKTKNLQDRVLFLGVRKDAAELYQAFDCFVFPSLHEGLGIVAIEAQAAGLPCVLADTLPQEAFICNCRKLPLTSAADWANEILSFTQNFKRQDTSIDIQKAGFSSKEVTNQIQTFYLNLEK